MHTQFEPHEYVELALGQAIDAGASDLYWIPGADMVQVRLRVQGEQRELTSLPRPYGQRCTTRIKVLAGLLTYRTNVSQDGVIAELRDRGRVNLRVSVMPTSHGERVSIRLHESAARPRTLESLGFPCPVVEALRRMLARPAGMIVLTGPTGCGKTTTIYALLRELIERQQDPASIITIEDPIELRIPGISQVSVSATPEWGYAAALRAALRQDVKTLAVGEMRDRDVVGVTLDAALTGHRVITTYHAGDIPAVYARMLHQGFEPFLVASAVTGVLSQRLVRRANGEGRTPVVAVLEPDEAWQEFLTGTPALGELRRKAREYPLADLDAAARRMPEPHPGSGLNI